ncbi:MAG: bifunctional 5,10-methylenetetrahydrofolate dehydrogenase/5,10-methenyltetrahydrofolate cyclohydrolase [Candidatus Omnitrophica bacterium]|nr:bifunctional 5,10-methylenetetrahydrofolate dehydrogenase/5,10-methenyltetrahydrofolate cyclohydrolase [Candidatus Omnitrophota bacterium]
MSAQILDGKVLAAKIKEELRMQVASFKKAHLGVPRVVNVAVGDYHATCVYANSQIKAAEEIGIDYKLDVLPKDISGEKLIAHIDQLNHDAGVNGIMIHKPLPRHIDYHDVANHIDIVKDLEGVNVTNIGKMLLGKTNIIPCTPAAVMELIKSTGVNLRGKEVVIVGHSDIVGKPLSLLLLREMATVTVCHIATSEAGKLAEHVSRADVLVVAVGKPELVKGDWIKKGAMVIDVGINRVGSKIVGDVEFLAAQARASYITPVPGGVGPVTVVMLMKNAIEAFQLQAGQR